MKFIKEHLYSFDYSTEDLFNISKINSNVPNLYNLDAKSLKKHNNEYLKKYNLDISKEEINKFMFRSDEFIENHDTFHIVFSGCSNTWGTGIIKEELWSYKTYKLISENKECSGYFNLGIIGTNTAAIITNLFKYFIKYGNPNVIFINFPDSLRFFCYDDLNEKYYDAFYKKDSKEMLDLINFNYYLMLEQYCKSNNIQLYSFSWIEAKQRFLFPHEVLEVPFDSFKTYYKIDSNDIYNNLNKDKELNKDKQYLEFARDRMHPGPSFHNYWSNFIYDKYIKNQ
jgi:hypothetical protein